VTEFEIGIGIGTEIGIEIGIGTEIRIEIGIEIDRLFVFIIYILYINTPSWSIHMPHQRPPGRVIYGFTMTNWPRGF
jgi:hypothetical protein